jgi:hypothetical protein
MKCLLLLSSYIVYGDATPPSIDQKSTKDGSVDDGAAGVGGVEVDADAEGIVPRWHVGAVRDYLDGHVGPVAVDLGHRRRRRPPHHLRPRRLLAAHSLSRPGLYC